MQQIFSALRRNTFGQWFHRCHGKVATLFTSSLSTNTNAISPDFIVKCPYEDTVIPETSFCDHVFQHFPKYGKKTALIDGVTGREYSYNEVQESVVNVASGLVRSGMQKGDVLCIVAPNSPQVCVTYFATVACGGVFSTCNSSYTADELVYQFKNSGSRYIATTPAMLPTVREAANKAGCIERMVILGDDGGLGEGENVMSYQSLVKDSGSRFPNDLKVNSKEDIAILPYSSGTTGLPKGVMLTHHNVIANVCQVDHKKFINFRDQDHLNICVLPFYHIYALIIIFANNLYQGTKTLILPKFEPETFLKTIQDYRCTDAPMVPPLLIFMAQHPSVKKYNISSLKRVMSAAAPLSAELCAAVKSRTSIEVIRQGYGMTELSPLSHYCPMDADNPGSVGVPVLNTICKVIDVENGASLGPNCDGEVLAKGPQIMKGYLNNPKATAATINDDGWIHTGDIGCYDENGFFYVTDRLKELIKVKGLQVAPAELEALLLQHPLISDVAVIGVDDERSGELPRAFVVRSSDELSEQEVEDFVKGRVAEHKQLKGGVKFMNEIPKSASGKILRRLLRK